MCTTRRTVQIESVLGGRSRTFFETQTIHPTSLLWNPLHSTTTTTTTCWNPIDTAESCDQKQIGWPKNTMSDSASSVGDRRWRHDANKIRLAGPLLQKRAVSLECSHLTPGGERAHANASLGMRRGDGFANELATENETDSTTSSLGPSSNNQILWHGDANDSQH